MLYESEERMRRYSPYLSGKTITRERALTMYEEDRKRYEQWDKVGKHTPSFSEWCDMATRHGLTIKDIIYAS